MLMLVVSLLFIAIIAMIWIYDPYLDISRNEKGDLQIILWYDNGDTRSYVKILGDQ